jgi:hypothetical protein
MSNWGPTTVERHTWWKARGHDLRVWVRGVDVTDRCRYFDDTIVPPVAELYRLDDQGHKYQDANGHPVVDVEHDFTVTDVVTVG